MNHTKITPTFDELESVIAEDNYAGWCLNCGSWTHDSCEPDARKYECPECGLHTVYGAEQLLMEGLYQEEPIIDKNGNPSWYAKEFDEPISPHGDTMNRRTGDDYDDVDR